MTPLFTIHAGEYLVGSYIERHFKQCNVWIPSVDKGIDLLITDKANQKTISIQVKFSKDFSPTYLSKALQENTKSFGWWSLKRDSIVKSTADLWVFVMLPFASTDLQFVIVEPQVLLERLSSIHGQVKTIQTYLWVTDKGRCWESRRLRQAELNEIARGHFSDVRRDLTQYLNAWDVIEANL